MIFAEMGDVEIQYFSCYYIKEYSNKRGSEDFCVIGWRRKSHHFVLRYNNKVSRLLLNKRDMIMFFGRSENTTGCRLHVSFDFAPAPPSTRSLFFQFFFFCFVLPRFFPLFLLFRLLPEFRK